MTRRQRGRRRSRRGFRVLVERDRILGKGFHARHGAVGELRILHRSCDHVESEPRRGVTGRRRGGSSVAREGIVHALLTIGGVSGVQRRLRVEWDARSAVLYRRRTCRCRTGYLTSPCG